MTSNRQIRQAVRNTDPYKSRFTGQDVDMAIKNARNLREYVDQNILVPHINFTGDLAEVKINTFEHTTWLYAVAIMVVKPFSESTPNYIYEIVSNGRSLLTIPADVMMLDAGNSTMLVVNQLIEPGETVSMVGNSTNAFGDLRVKLILA